MGEEKKFKGFFNPLKNEVNLDGTTVKYAIKPKIGFKDILKGNYGKAVGNTKVSLNIVHKPEDTVELFLNINGQPFKLNKDGSYGKYDITFGATKTF